MTLVIPAGAALGQAPSFTYQGKIAKGGNPASGHYDFQCKLFNTQSVGTGTQQGPPVLVSNCTVNNGTFTVQLDFGAGVFDGTAWYLEIAVKLKRINCVAHR